MISYFNVSEHEFYLTLITRAQKYNLEPSTRQ